MTTTIAIHRLYTDWPTEELVACLDCGEPVPERDPGNDRCGWCSSWRAAVAEDLDECARDLGRL